MNIFIPAAGFGSRLSPITSRVPKPLLPIVGKPLLGLSLEKLNRLKPNQIGINLHYLREALTQWVAHSPLRNKIKLFPEEMILGSGGALNNAYSLLCQDHFLVYNSDVLCDLDLPWLMQQHLDSENLVTLTTCQQPKFSHVKANVAINAEGIFQGIDKKLIPYAEVAQYVAYTSIAVYSPEFLQFLPAGKSSILDAWLTAATKGYRIGTVDISAYDWNDIGTPSAYFSAAMANLRSTGKSVYIHPSANVNRATTLEGEVIIERYAVVEAGVSIKNCLLLPGAELIKNRHYENSIIGPDYVLPM